MRRHKAIIVLGALIVAVLLLGTVSYTVDQTNDIVLVLEFGEVVKTLSGAENAGLHFKWPYPIQRVERLDRRDHVLVSEFRQLQISQKNNITVTVFCIWRIDDATAYYKAQRNRNIDEAIRAQLSSALTGVMGKVSMDELVNTDAKKMQLDTIEKDIKGRLAPRVMEDYGIEVVEVGLKSLGLPKTVSETVIANMAKEREQEVSRLKAEGQAVADAIVGRAKAAREKILAFASRKAGDIRTEGEAKAAEAYAQFEKHPEFSMFLRSIESLRASLKNRTVFILDASTLPVLEWLQIKPTLDTFKKR